MQIDLQDFAHYFTSHHFRVINVWRSVIEPGRKCLGVVTPPFSGFVFPIRGKARMRFNGTPYEMSEGMIYHAGPNMALDKEVLSATEWEFIVIHYLVEHRTPLCQPYAQSHFQLPIGPCSRLNDLLYRLYQSCDSPGNCAELKSKSLFFAIIDEIVTSAAAQRHAPQHQLVTQAIAYIASHYMQDIAIPALAAQYGLNSKQFSYLFQKHTGTTPNDYLINCRIERAKELLYTSSASISEVSTCVGYHDPYYFSKLFKKRTGVTPSSLRLTAGC